MESESQGNPCCQSDLMMIKMIIVFFEEFVGRIFI